MASVVTPYFRVSFPALFEKKLNKLNNKMEYGVVALFPKGTDFTAMKAAAKEAAIAKWGPDPKKWPKFTYNPFRPHEEKAKKDDEGNVIVPHVLPDGHEAGGIFMNFKSEKNKPQVIGPQKEEIVDQSDVYSGCWARASVNAYGWVKGDKSGISFGLGNLQKIKEGDPLGSRTRAQDDFEPVAGAAGAAGAGVESANDLFA